MTDRILYLDGKIAIYESPTASELSEMPVHVGNIICVLVRQGSFSYKSCTQYAYIDTPGILVFSTTSFDKVIDVSDDFTGSVLNFSSAFIHSLDIKHAHLLRAPVSIPDEGLGQNECEFSWFIHDSVCHAIEDESPNHGEIVSLLTKAFFLKIERHFVRIVNIEERNRQENITDRFLKMVAEHCAQHRELEFYANELCITPKYLSSVVSKTTGRKSQQWIEEYVITYAKRLLSETDMPINQIADSMNFIAPTDFCRYFRMRTGMTPRKFRMS